LDVQYVFYFWLLQRLLRLLQQTELCCRQKKLHGQPRQTLRHLGVELDQLLCCSLPLLRKNLQETVRC
jgi:hypothetical protein